MPDKPAPTTGPGGPPQTEDADTAASNNAASNGYWIHDEIGPKHYVAPPHGEGNGDQAAGLIIAQIETALARHEIDASRMQVSLDGGQLVLGGIAKTAEDSEKAGHAANEVAGKWIVVTRLSVVTGL